MAPRKRRKPLNAMAKKATGSKKTKRKKTPVAPFPTNTKTRTGGAVAAAVPLPFNNALPADKRKKKGRKGKKENTGRRRARR